MRERTARTKGDEVSEHQQCHITIDNRTADHLVLLQKDAKHGEFRDGPEQDIKPHTELKAFVAIGSGLVGPEGTVVYKIGDDANTTVSIYFDVPAWSEANTVRADTSNPDFVASLIDFSGKGQTESCKVRVK